jgi:polar amino acid transport system substrate-binding protein
VIRRLLAFALALLPATTLAAALQTVEPGKLTWGASPTFIPFEIMTDGKPQGFDIDMMEALGKQVGLQSTMMAMDFKGIIPGLLGGRMDAGVSGFYITPERLAVVDMIPYAVIGNQMIVAKGNPKHITGYDGLCGTKIGVPVNTVFEVSAKKAADKCNAEGKPTDVLSLPGSNLVALALAQGRVDCALNSTATAAAMMSETPDTYELAGPAFDANTKLGIAVRRDDPAMLAALQGALKTLMENGTYAALLAKWNLQQSALVN